MWEGEEVCLVHVGPCAGIDASADVVSGGAGLEDLKGFERESDSAGKLQRILCIKMVWVGNSRPCLEEIAGWLSLSADGEAKRRCLLQHGEGVPAVHDRVGIG